MLHLFWGGSGLTLTYSCKCNHVLTRKDQERNASSCGVKRCEPVSHSSQGGWPTEAATCVRLCVRVDGSRSCVRSHKPCYTHARAASPGCPSCRAGRQRRAGEVASERTARRTVEGRTRRSACASHAECAFGDSHSSRSSSVAILASSPPSRSEHVRSSWPTRSPSCCCCAASAS